ncbi:MAG: tRNA lysidine(34) synthetase TilS, partial [Chitinophagales bacterium]|nr:tRNA lysidine(34) synthetase TilS [Chitinophagales bacterium]
MVEKFLALIKSQSLFNKGEPILLAVSGGIDSMVMTHLFTRCNFRFAIAHINFHLRNQDSIDDEAFIVQHSELLSIPHFKIKVDTGERATEKGISIQIAARELRYAWLEKIRKEHGYHFIATAHHSDDSVETVLLNIFRGTGLSGLGGIQAKRGKVIRPLLPFTKREIEAYAKENNLSFRTDKSNLEIEYDRNKIRLKIIPAIEQFYPVIKQTLRDNIFNWQDAISIYQQQIDLLRNRLIDKRDDEIYITISKIQNQKATGTVLFEILRPYGFRSEQIAPIIASFNSISGKVFYSKTHRLLKDRKHLIITDITIPYSSEELIMEQDTEVTTALIQLKIQTIFNSDFKIPMDDSISCLDYDKLEFPLLLRRWNKGDYFYPLGMNGKKKKISDFLINKKIPIHQKEQTFVIVSGEKMACIVGIRIDERFKVTNDSKKFWV